MNRGWLRRWSALEDPGYPAGVALLSALLTFCFGVCAYLVIENKMPSQGGFSIWQRWDAGWYIDVARHGYTGDPASERRYLITFFPLYPFAVHLVSYIVKSIAGSALVVSNLACVGAFVYCYKLTRQEFDTRSARAAVFYFSVFPTAYFLHVGYSESLFLFLTMAAFYYARRERWLLSSLFGMCATASRVSGIALLLPLAIEYMQQRRFRWVDMRRDALWLLLVPAGLAFYLWLNYYYFGDPLKFLEFQRNHWYRYLRSPAAAIKSNWLGLLGDKPIERVIQHGSGLAAFIIGTVITAIAPWRLRACYTTYLLINWVLIYCDSFTLSSPRYLLTDFPLFMLMGRWHRPGLIRYAITMSSLLFYGLFTLQFVRGWWAH